MSNTSMYTSAKLSGANNLIINSSSSSLSQYNNQNQQCSMASQQCNNGTVSSFSSVSSSSSTLFTTVPSNSNIINNSSSNNTNSNAQTTTNKQFLNSSTIKLIQRLLDEASQTGDLIFNNKNLNEFPSKLAMNYDLSDTITADLSKNHLVDFPKELCFYDSLEKLSLYSNLIRNIPEIMPHQLRCLKLLDLNSNNLTYIPASLCNLASLQVLTINNNKLVSLPEEIGRLDKLIQLDVSCNEITHLPVQIGDMSSLRALNVRRNLLVELPKEISQLKLVSFDCSSNRLSKLPLCFRELTTLIDLVVDHNPLEVPPAHICTKGLLHIMKYLLVEAIKEEKKRGVLTEYEINTQYNSNTLNHQNSNSNGHSVIGFSSYMFQSSVRNMCKKFGSISSSCSSSSSSNSSSISSVCSLQQQTTNQTKPAQIPINSSPSSSSNTTPTNYMINTEQIDFADAIPSSSSPSSSSSSSSYASSSSPPMNKVSIKTHKLPDASNSKLVSIHELIKSPLKSAQYTNPNNNTNNYVKLNQSRSNTNSDLINDCAELMQDKQQHIWRLNEQQQQNRKLIQQQDDQYILAKNNCNNNNNKNNYNLQQQQFAKIHPSDATNNNGLQSHYINNVNSKRLTNDCQLYEFVSATNNSSRTIYSSSGRSLSSSACTHSEGHVKRLSNENNSHTIIGADEEIIVSPNDNCMLTVDQGNQEYFKSNQPPQQHQQVWIPRDDISVQYGQGPLSPNTLSNGKELPPDLNNINPAFTIRRHLIQIQEEYKQIESLKKTIEAKLKVKLPCVSSSTSFDELGIALSDGVVLCHLVNQIFPRAVQIIHVPSLAVPKLSLAKCRKNVENFIDACRRIGLPENDMCCAHDIIEAKNTIKVARTVMMLVNYNSHLHQPPPIDQHSTMEQYRQTITTIGNAMMSPPPQMMPQNQSQPNAQPQQQTAV